MGVFGSEIHRFSSVPLRLTYRLYIDFRPHPHSVHIYLLSYSREIMFSRETDILQNSYTCEPAMAVDLVNFSSSQPS